MRVLLNQPVSILVYEPSSCDDCARKTRPHLVGCINTTTTPRLEATRDCARVSKIQVWDDRKQELVRSDRKIDEKERDRKNQQDIRESERAYQQSSCSFRSAAHEHAKNTITFLFPKEKAQQQHHVMQLWLSNYWKLEDFITLSRRSRWLVLHGADGLACKACL